MRPHDTRSKTAVRGAVQTHLRSAVGWLRGFPAAAAQDGGPVVWVTLPDPRWRAAPAEIVVDRARLRRTLYGLRSLERRFPRALPDLVGDLDAWRLAVTGRLDLLKACVHDGRPLPTLAALLGVAHLAPSLEGHVRRLAHSAPDVEPLLRSVLWAAWADDAPLANRLGEIEAHARAYAGVLRFAAPQAAGGARALAHRLLDLRLRGDVSQGLLQLLGDERLWRLPPVAPTAARKLARAYRGTPVGAGLTLTVSRPPAGALARSLAGVVLEPSRSRGLRHRRLGLVARLAGPEVLDERQVFWERLATLCRDLNRRLGLARQRVDADRDIEKALLEDVESLAESPTSRGDLADLVAVADDLAPEAYDLLLQVLDLLPRVQAGDRLREQVVRGLRLPSGLPSPARVVDVLRCVRGVLQEVVRHPDSPRRAAWFDLAAGMGHELVWDVFEEGRSRRRIQILEEAAPLVVREREARAAVKDEAVGGAWLSHLVALVATGAEAAEAARVVAALAPDVTKHGMEPRHLASVARLARGDSDAYARLFALLDGPAWQLALRDALVPIVDVPGLDAVLAALLLGPSCEEVVAFVRLAARLGAADKGALRDVLASFETYPEAACAEDGAWMDDYPAALRAELADLACHDPQARETAVRVLGRRFPTPAERANEIQHLRTELPFADPAKRRRLEARIRHLETWRTDDVSPRRLARYARVLRRRVDLAKLRRLRVSVRLRLDRVLAERLGDVVLVEGRVAAGDERLLAAIAAQEPAYRELGFALVRRRWRTRPPWDLRDEPANRAFVERARAEGLDLAPWLDPAPAVAVDASNGTRLLVGIETDPLEAMRMGQPFDTCLSPGAFNFYAAIVNVADVNKQVLYARDEAGRIRGRCLLALTKDLGLLTFQPYTSRSELRFDRIARDVALDLARNMGTDVALDGEVEVLTAPDWYCDLPHDLPGYRERLERLRAAFSDVEPGTLPARLRAALGVERLGPWVLTPLVEWEEIRSQPERLLELEDLLGASTLPATTAVALARLLRRAGEGERAWQVLAPLLERAASAGTPVPGMKHLGIEGELAQEVVRLGAPSAALRLLRRTREPWVRDPEQETWVGRLEAAGMACEALHRRNQARALYRRALRDGVLGPKDGVRRRLARLEAP